jgi:hypothetical protein
MRLFSMHAHPPYLFACPSNVTIDLFALGHQCRLLSHTCFVFHSTQYSQLSIVSLHTHCWSLSQPLSFFSISPLFLYMHIVRAFHNHYLSSASLHCFSTCTLSEPFTTIIFLQHLSIVSLHAHCQSLSQPLSFFY